MSVLNLLSTEIEDDLRSTVRGLLRDLCDPVAVTALYDGDRTAVDGLWKTLAVDLGLAGLLVPEERGGAGASAREAAVVLEELGRAAAPVPFLTSAVVATTMLLRSDADARALEPHDGAPGSPVLKVLCLIDSLTRSQWRWRDPSRDRRAHVLLQRPSLDGRHPRRDLRKDGSRHSIRHCGHCPRRRRAK
jgi:hypothetical protein